jgi:hypothetical protein
MILSRTIGKADKGSTELVLTPSDSPSVGLFECPGTPNRLERCLYVQSLLVCLCVPSHLSGYPLF